MSFQSFSCSYVNSNYIEMLVYIILMVDTVNVFWVNIISPREKSNHHVTLRAVGRSSCYF